MTKIVPRYELSAELSGYVAGLIDGEGCISIDKARFKNRPWLSDRYTAILSVGNTSKNMIDVLTTAFGGTVHFRPGNANHKACYIWSVRGPKAKAVLDVVGPNLRVKNAQSDLLIEFVRDFRSFKGGSYPRWHAPRVSPDELARHERIWLEIKALNRPGPAGRTPG
ncbi:MAG TPA: hypothetical protein VGT60_01780 [Candidatus Limnocylindria bacterium]|nr:hypothetical protein [Candidatus Limnocylindria bacterium]